MCGRERPGPSEDQASYHHARPPRERPLEPAEAMRCGYIVLYWQAKTRLTLQTSVAGVFRNSSQLSRFFICLDYQWLRELRKSNVDVTQTGLSLINKTPMTFQTSVPGVFRNYLYTVLSGTD